MECSTSGLNDPREQQDAQEQEACASTTVDTSKNEEKNSNSDTNSEDLSSNDEQNNLNSDTNSQFYESSDSKIDYAVKIDDNDTLSDIEDIKTDTASADSEDSALGSLPPDTAVNEREEEVHDRSDGSDSGIGSETPEESKLPSFNLALPSTSGQSNLQITEEVNNDNDTSSKTTNENKINTDNYEPPPNITKPQRSSLKRKCNESNDEPESKKKKVCIRFDNVTVYYFPRAQGFSCVPSQGGSTLGMEWEHSHIQMFTLAEHALEQRRLHRQVLQQLKSERHSLQGASLSSSEDSDTEEEASDVSESELDLDSYYFLQPVPTRQRRSLLRAAGVRKIEGYEKDECRDIRTSREFCGCACKGICNPENCSCSIGGIKCQVDRLNFPCGCTRDGCGNTTGRIEFNPVRVRTHFIHTLMRIGLEKKNEENQEAAKRQQWAALNAKMVPCTSNASYEREHCSGQADSLLRDVNLTPRVEVESCVNNGSFNHVHCDMVNTSAQSNVSEDMVYNNYRNNAQNHRNLNKNHIMQYGDINNQHSLTEPYTSNILQGKGPPYPTGNTMGFETMANNIQRFPCDLNYTYEHHTENSHFKGLQSFSATSFEEFAHNSQMSMFSHYGHMYVQDYLPKPSTSISDHTPIYHGIAQNHYDLYKNTAECAGNSENKNDAHYTTLMTMPYQTSNKLQTLENDENWFSQNTMMTMDQSDHTTQDASDVPPQSETTADSNTAECTENFGELIKKTMVDSITV